MRVFEHFPGLRNLWRIAIPLALLMSGCGGSGEPATVALRTVVPLVDATALSTSPATVEPEATSTIAPAPSATGTATPSPTLTPAPSSTATATPTPTATTTPEPTPTPTPSPVPPTPTVTEGTVAITWIDFDPAVGRDGDGEAVTLVNSGESPVDMTGWSLSDIAEHIYIFPTFILEPGAAVVVHICAGEDNAEILFWGRCSAIWNNEGDTAFLRDATGRDISTYSY